MMYKTNFIVLVLSATRHKVVIWDDFERKNRTEISFNSVVRNIKLRKDMLVVVLDTKTFVFSFMNLKLIENVETGPNPYGLCGLATAEKAVSKTLVVLNNTQKYSKIGRIRVLSYGKFSYYFSKKCVVSEKSI
jgi:WD repeat-containing protein 45